MSIRKKCIIFVSIVVIVPMILILMLSNVILNNQIDKSAQGYLENAFIIAKNQMLNQLDEMEKISIKTTNSSDFKRELKDKNISMIDENIDELKEVYDYVDLYFVFSDDKRLILNHPSIKGTNLDRLNELLDKAKEGHKTIISEEIFNLDDLFYYDSKEYNKLKVKIDNADENEYLNKSLVAITISPVYDKKEDRLLGFLALGSTINNNDYFPKAYSKNVENSYLSISIDKIRISSNIRSPKKENYVGSLNSISIKDLNKSEKAYFGKQNIGGEIHMFLDKPISNCDGECVAVLGVGIPENKFSIIMHMQRNIIVFVCAVFLIIMLFICRYVSKKLTTPIIKATELANQISKGNNEVIIDKKFLEDNKDETIILLKAFKKMADDLKCAENEQKIYLKNIKDEQIEQKKLSRQLFLLNESLEEKVKLRTEDLREAIKGLKEADKIKSLFLANMSHELRTPLSAIITCSEILKEEIFGELNSKQLKHITNILNSGNHLLQLINNVLDISKIEAGKMKLTIGEYSISDIAMESFSVLKSLAYRKNIEINLNIEPSDFIIKIDANKLKQILYNLLSNSIKFTEEGGKVQINITKNLAYMKLVVEDNGIGIKKEDQKRIFNEFEQVDNSYERKYEGTGLGLPLTKKLVEMHGGEIFLVSNIDIGTKVIVTIPVQQEDNTYNIVSSIN
ncbi:ATP-binding protein [Clostridium sp. VAP23]|uniref:ATP-binding protein n=1 Tax=Clostridium sp. VAP23 TaxID=2949981 RepID=UPI00207A3ECD|nr:ATP-binding protein [Clostridium sp. VAP23]